MRTVLPAAALLVWFSVPVQAAERPVTQAEAPLLTAAVVAQGCTGGKMQWDEGDKEFEVDDAKCGGRTYDLKFNADYTLKSKKQDD